MKLYGISETFYSLQGEGLYAGTPMVFIRFSGCNYSCPWCDTDYGFKFESSAVDLAAAVKGIWPTPRHVCFTGGEPALHDLHPIMDAIEACTHAVKFHIETNGSQNYGKYLDRAFVTVSPKNPDGSPVTTAGTWMCDQLKVVDQGQDLELYNAIAPIGGLAPMYLQPLWTENEEDNLWAMKRTAARAMHHGRFRMSIQTHKILGVR